MKHQLSRQLRWSVQGGTCDDAVHAVLLPREPYVSLFSNTALFFYYCQVSLRASGFDWFPWTRLFTWVTVDSIFRMEYVVCFPSTSTVVVSVNSLLRIR